MDPSFDEAPLPGGRGAWHCFLAPLFLAASESMWRTLYEAYAWFVAAFRDAAEKLRAGDRAAPFPRGSFPPALPFVGG